MSKKLKHIDCVNLALIVGMIKTHTNNSLSYNSYI